MDRFIGTNRIFDTMEANGTARYFAPGQQPEGWVELKGRLSDKSAPLPHGEWRQCSRLVQTIMDDIEARTIRRPEALPESLMQFLLSFAEHTEQHYCAPASWAGIAQDPLASPASAAAEAQRLARWSRDLTRGVRHDAVPGAA